MHPVPIKPRPFPTRLIVAAAILLTVSVQADQTLGNDPFPGKEPGFFQRASDNVGGFFRRIFRTDEPKQPQQPAPSPYKSRSRGPRYNLDQPPAELRSTQADSNRSGSTSPATTTARDSTANNAKSKPAAGSPTRNTALVEDPPKSKPKPQKSPATDAKPPVASNEPVSRPKTSKPAESASDSTSAGSVLYSNTGTTNTKQPEPPARVQTENVPTPPKVPAESSNVLTGSKTGKSGRVKSPYAPYSELDVTGLPSGSLALDPTTQKVFRIP